MSHILKGYYNLLRKIINNGSMYDDPMRSTRRKVCYSESVKINFDEHLINTFPLVQARYIDLDKVFYELQWFLRGESSIQYMLKNNTHIWLKDVVNYQKRLGIADNISPTLVKRIDTLQDSGRSYPVQLRYHNVDYEINWSGLNLHITSGDQLSNFIYNLIENPQSSSNLISYWNVSDIMQNRMLDGKSMALEPCHVLFQANIEPRGKLGQFMHMSVYMRSWDVILGGPFNIASYSLLMRALCDLLNYSMGTLTIFSANAHIYEPHIPAAEEILRRIDTEEYKELPYCQLEMDIPSTLETDSALEYLTELWDIHWKDKESSGIKLHYEHLGKMKIPMLAQDKR